MGGEFGRRKGPSRARPTVFLAVDDEKRRHVLAEAVQRAIELCSERRV